MLAKQNGLMMSKKKTAKSEKSKRIPSSVEDFVPYIEGVKAGFERDTKYLNAINTGEAQPDPRAFGLTTVEEVFNKINTAREFRWRIINNWETWVKYSAPVTVTDDKTRTIIDLNDPSCEWYLGEDYYRELTKHTGKWRDIISLRGAMLVGDTDKANAIIEVYNLVMREYTYCHGFKSWDEYGIVPHENWREKMGALFIIGDTKKVVILK
jgi:hypothetical protein